MTHKEQAEKYLETLDHFGNQIADPEAEGYISQSVLNSLTLISSIAQAHATLALQEENEGITFSIEQISKTLVNGDLWIPKRGVLN